MARRGAIGLSRLFSAALLNMASMKKLLTLIFATLLLASASQAIEGSQIAASDPAPAPGRRASMAQSVRANADMQVACREVFVDIDQGYGVTSRESRFICDEAR